MEATLTDPRSRVTAIRPTQDEFEQRMTLDDLTCDMQVSHAYALDKAREAVEWAAKVAMGYRLYEGHNVAPDPNKAIAAAAIATAWATIAQAARS